MDVSKYIGRKVSSATLTDVNGCDDYMQINFSDGGVIRIFSRQSCCETLHFTCDDDLSRIASGVLIGIEEKPGPVVEDEFGNTYEQSFVDIITTCGTVTFTAHNEHNGYYGGFSLEIIEVAP